MKIIAISALANLIFLACFSQTKATYVSLQQNGQEVRGILNDLGKLVVPIEYKYIVSDSNIYIVSKDGLWGCLNESGNIIVPIKYQDIGVRRSEGIIRVRIANKWGFVNLHDSTIIEFVYDFACNFQDGKAYVRQNERNFYINPKGEKLNNSTKIIDFCPEDTDTATAIRSQFEDHLLSISETNNKFGVIEIATKKIIIPEVYDEIGLYYNGVILVRKEKKWGAYNDNGKLITDPTYSDIGIFWNLK